MIHRQFSINRYVNENAKATNDILKIESFVLHMLHMYVILLLHLKFALKDIFSEKGKNNMSLIILYTLAIYATNYE